MTTASLPTVLIALAPSGKSAGMAAALSRQADAVVAETEADALAMMAEHDVQAVICGPCGSGALAALLTQLSEEWPETQCVLVEGEDAGNGTLLAEVATHRQIHAFLSAPVSPDHLRLAVEGACRAFQLARENARLSLERHLLAPRPVEPARDRLVEGLAFDAILRAPGSPMEQVIEQAARIASFDVPVVIRGEPATGQSALAHAIHRTSLRSDRPFHALDCAGLPDEALRLELFGARHGALPGLAASRTGLAQRAHRGTLFLDRVEALGPAMQLAVMRLVEDGSARPLGSSEAQPAAPRLIAGTGVDLAAEVEAGRFRADLFYALAVTQITVPPLRDRTGDIASIAVEMLADASRLHAKPVQGFTADALDFLSRHSWPGNLRELENEVTRMLIAADGPALGAELISRQILQQPVCGCCCDADRTDTEVMVRQGTLKARVEEIEARILTETLTRLKWNKSRAASELGLSRVGLRAKLDRYGLAPPGTEQALEPAAEEGR